ncbi:MAG TPA: RES family NAD+ phosphorylase [Balneolaceae bacterium]|nr:RES family NAD+ phosphorylase [Balneolaceae bacterium]
MKLYRILRKKYIRDLSGEGARLVGGRWNPKGVPLVYTSTHESLAALETLVHSPMRNLPHDLHLAVLNFPDNLPIRAIDKKDLPNRWMDFPAPSKLKSLGEEWYRAKTHIALKVPSAIISSEFNILLNPLHSKFNTISIEDVRPFTFDPRLTL